MKSLTLIMREVLILEMFFFFFLHEILILYILSCVDINECEKSPEKCQGGICENNPGGFTCKCPAGFMYDGVEMCKGL